MKFELTINSAEIMKAKELRTERAKYIETCIRYYWGVLGNRLLLLLAMGLSEEKLTINVINEYKLSISHQPEYHVRMRTEIMT